MKIGVIRETKPYEKRTALSPDSVKQLVKKGHSVIIEQGAGDASFFSDGDFTAAGASVVSKSDALQAELVLKVNPQQCTLVPDAENVITSNQGWDTVKHKIFLTDVINQLHEHNIRVSIFINPAIM